MLSGINVLSTRGTVGETALMFSLLFNSNHQFLTGETFSLVGTHADIDGVHCFSLVGFVKVLRDTGLSIKGAFAVVTGEGGWTMLSFGFWVIGSEILQTGWTMVRVLVTSMSAFIIVRLEAATAEIRSSQKARKRSDGVKVLLIVK